MYVHPIPWEIFNAQRGILSYGKTKKRYEFLEKCPKRVVMGVNEKLNPMAIQNGQDTIFIDVSQRK